MNTAAEILRFLDSLGVTIRVNERGNLAVRPTDRVTPEMARHVKEVEPDIRRLLRERDTERASETPAPHEPAQRIVEAYFQPTVELIFPEARCKVMAKNPEFPSCPKCGQARYWISPSGKVSCGECGEVRFILAAIEYHPVN